MIPALLLTAKGTTMSNEAARPTSAVAWRNVQAVGTLAISLALLSVLALSQELIPPVLIFGALYLVVAGTVWRLSQNRWASIIGAVLVVLGIAGNAPFLMEDLAHPETWGSFGPAAIMVVGAVTAVGAAVMALRNAPAEGTRGFSMGAAGLGVLLVLATVVLSLTASSDSAEAGDVSVAAEGAEFPETVEVASGTWLHLENNDLFRHTFVVEGQDVKVEMPGGKDRRVQIDLAPGEYRFICDVPGHERMEGTLTVR